MKPESKAVIGRASRVVTTTWEAGGTIIGCSNAEALRSAMLRTKGAKSQFQHLRFESA